MGVFERAFRRAQLPVRMSQGFNPRPRFSLPAALARGSEGVDEVLELELTEHLPAEEVAHRLSRELPKQVEITLAELLEPGVKARVESVNYRVLGEFPTGAVERCAAAEELCTTRRGGKEIDIRAYLNVIEPCDGGCEFELSVTDEGTARPAEVAEALCNGDAELVRHLSLVRTAVNLAAPQ